LRPTTIVVPSADIMTIPPEEILTAAEKVYTIVGGEVRYHREG